MPDSSSSGPLGSGGDEREIEAGDRFQRVMPYGTDMVQVEGRIDDDRVAVVRTSGARQVFPVDTLLNERYWRRVRGVRDDPTRETLRQGLLRIASGPDDTARKWAHETLTAAARGVRDDNEGYDPMRDEDPDTIEGGASLARSPQGEDHEAARILQCPECGRVASVPDYYSRPICVHAWDGGAPEIWDGDDDDGAGRKVEDAPNEKFRTPGPHTWAVMVPFLAARQRDDWKHRAEMLQAEAERWREMGEGAMAFIDGLTRLEHVNAADGAVNAVGKDAREFLAGASGGGHTFAYCDACGAPGDLRETPAGQTVCAKCWAIQTAEMTHDGS